MKAKRVAAAALATMTMKAKSCRGGAGDEGHEGEESCRDGAGDKDHAGDDCARGVAGDGRHSGCATVVERFVELDAVRMRTHKSHHFHFSPGAIQPLHVNDIALTYWDCSAMYVYDLRCISFTSIPPPGLSDLPEGALS